MKKLNLVLLLIMFFSIISTVDAALPIMISTEIQHQFRCLCGFNLHQEFEKIEESCLL